MDFSKLIARARAILLTPKTEWPVIAEEVTTPADLYRGYILILAAIPAICSPFFRMWGMGLGGGLSGMIVTYVLALAGTFIIALIVDALAPTFAAQKNQTQALKTVAYAYTASWVAGVGYLVPGLGGLIVLAGALYSVYLLYLGLPNTMKCPPDRALGYTAVIILVAVIVSVVIGAVAGGVMSVRNPMVSTSENVQFDQDSKLGQLQGWTEKMQAASKQMEAAQKSGDAKAQGDAVGAMMATALGGGDQVQALEPARIKALLPESLRGMNRTTAAAQRSGALGVQVSQAKASYVDGEGKTLELDITDTAGMRGLTAFAAWANIEEDKDSDSGYEKTYKQGGRLVHEKWDTHSKRGEYTVVVADRFTVQVSGTANSMSDLKAAAMEIDTSALEKMKNDGVKGG